MAMEEAGLMSIRQDSVDTFEALVEQYHPRTGNWLSDTKDLLLKFLQEFFANQAEGCFHYAPGDDWETAEVETEIIISDAGSINTATVEKRPAIIISRGPFAYANLGIDNFLVESEVTGERTHTDLLSGSFIVNCVSRVGLESEKIALLVAKALKIYRRILHSSGFFQIGQQIRIGIETPANSLVGGDSDEDFITVPVTFPVFYQESWTIKSSEVETLQKILYKALTVARTFSGSLEYPDSLDEDGNINVSSEGVIVSSWTYESE
jgi:hypothetical protein